MRFISYIQAGLGKADNQWIGERSLVNECANATHDEMPHLYLIIEPSTFLFRGV
jgi:hypothetical protein